MDRLIADYYAVQAGRFGCGVIITPSHNPPGDGGFKYNPPNGGPADTDITNWIQGRANELMKGGNAAVKRVGLGGEAMGMPRRRRSMIL